MSDAALPVGRPVKWLASPENYREYLTIQSQHLALWQAKLRPDVWREVKEYVMMTNDPDNARAFRGQDLVQIILDWPAPSAGYPPRIQPENVI